MGLLDRVGRFLDDVLLLPDDVRDAVERAERDLEKGAADRAEEGFLAVLAVRPSLARGWVGLARSREELGDRPGAREALDEARQLVPEDGLLALRAARLALEAGDPGAALEHGRAAAVRLPGSNAESASEVWWILARAERARGRPDRALRDLRKALTRSPEEPALRAELAELAAELDRPREVAAAVRGLVPDGVAPGVALRLGTSLARVGHGGADAWLLRASEAGRAEAMERLARLALERGEPEVAERWARRAVSAGGGGAALTVLAEVLVARDRLGEAAETFAAVSEVAGGDAELLRAAVRIAPLQDGVALVRHADALEELAPGDPAARAARAWAALGRGESDAAAQLIAGSGGHEPRGWLARAAWALEEGRPAEALTALGRFDAQGARHAWAVADRRRADALRREALRAAWRTPGGGVDLAGAMGEVARFARAHGIDRLERAATGLRDELDRPVRMAVLGEFNAGKSTLINAFLGAEVAPMGVLPTTATAHVLRAGADRRVRVATRDGRIREGPWETLGALLDEVGPSDVEQVEIVVPNELLERVWLVDTPGTNAGVEGHVERALETARRADVVLWVFDAAQAGKATEGEVLAAIRLASTVVLPVVNKRDRVAPDRLHAVERQVAAALDVAEVPTVSARRALAARTSGEDAGVEGSGFGELLRWLDREVFDPAPAIKRRVCAARLVGELDGVLAQEAETRQELERGLLAGAEVAAGLRARADALMEAVTPVCRELARSQERVLAEAGAELAALVRPSRRTAGRAEEREDRVFVAEDLGRRLATALDEAERSLLDRVEQRFAARDAGAAGEWIDRARQEMRAAVAAAVGRYGGYQQGLLEGGRIDRVFEGLRAGEAEVARAAETLVPAVADPWEHLGPGVREAMAAALSRLLAEHRRAQEGARRSADRRRSEVEEPLRALRDVLAGG